MKWIDHILGDIRLLCSIALPNLNRECGREGTRSEITDLINYFI
jgi:hypothetical protein